jgi:RNA polymerase sigma-70 factor, ECF subfamily
LTFETFDEEYVRRLADGDSDTGEHFATYFGNLLSLKLRMRVRSVQLIEDIQQETLTRVLEILREGSGVHCPERFGAFVHGVCKNVVREFCRSDGREEPWDENMDDPADSTVDLDAELVSADFKREIGRVFAKIPKKDRGILQAIYLDEIEKAEVCRMFGVDGNYLRVLIHRAKTEFRKAY